MHSLTLPLRHVHRAGGQAWAGRGARTPISLYHIYIYLLSYNLQSDSNHIYNFKIGPRKVRATSRANFFVPNEGHYLLYILVRTECEGGHYFSYILVRAECVRCPWLLAETKVATILGIFSHFWAPPLFKTPEGLVVGIQIFAWATTKYK